MPRLTNEDKNRIKDYYLKGVLSTEITKRLEYKYHICTIRAYIKKELIVYIDLHKNARAEASEIIKRTNRYSAQPLIKPYKTL